MKIRGWYKRTPDPTQLEPEREYVYIERSYDDAFGYGLRNPSGFNALVLQEDAVAAIEQARRETIEQCAQEAVLALWGEDRLACKVAAAIRARWDGK